MAFNPRDIPQPTRLVVYAAPDPSIFGDWERFDPTSTPAPCRAIPVTDEMRRNDARQQRERAAAVANVWRNRVVQKGSSK